MRSLMLLGCMAAVAVAAPLAAQEPAAPETTPAAAATPAREPVDPDSVAALQRMSTFLTSLNSFRLTSTSSLDVVTNDDQRLQIDSVAKYQVKKPGIAIDFQNDLKPRQFYYDGKQFTIYSPKLGYYATVPAPPTNREFLKELHAKTGIVLPLEDLFRWADGDDEDIRKLTSGFNVGTATIDGVPTDHWAFRQADFDWEVWIQQGPQPLPRKLVIIDRTDESKPGFTARLNWELNPTIPESAFTFTPDAKATRIEMTKPQETAQ